MTVTLVPSLPTLPAPTRPDPLGVLGVPGEINLDHAASAPCARAAADAVAELLPWYASVHRGAGALSRRCTLAYERARQTVADFLGARPDDHLIFTRNTTDAVNLLARALPAGTTVVTFAGEHHANLLPWPRGSVRLPVPASPAEAVRALDAALTELRRGTATGSGTPAGRSRPAAGAESRPGLPVLVAVTGASNVTGERWPVAELARVAHRHDARILVDAAQLAPHVPVDLAALDVDYLALSGHKLYAPFGAGVLVGRGDWLDAAPPYLVGGGATSHVGTATHEVRWASGPARHEAGTPNLLGAVALAAVCTALAEADRDALHAQEQALLTRLRTGIAALPHVVELCTFGPDAPRVGIVSFVVAGRDSAEVAAHLADAHRIGVRDGLFCAHPLARRLLAEAAARSGRSDLPPTALRASLGLGSTAAEVDALLTALATLP
ncbi:aminotransferase class V-fold PLP-dependent enzyme [Micromonospora sp. DR5-3]|uniref:aminotransferase class V-fold PLP-dependent enzyme n=1 Tax=unclassified Micromonospora TaxID=2617518 RepID=UPI0011D7F04B|nr:MULTISPECIES: aminotransferase class V-fold PLP-dependent enzyme [unclassified Micromonospora]MCW3812991.1 aminotransferase class V-fold PLP-dependent enzyme [Micromonospora sp. DR5-3]TYC26013.1 aminotransferase class V-fold PLP-dependent enzyme [Micromonospora sp. MP36]